MTLSDKNHFIMLKDEPFPKLINNINLKGHDSTKSFKQTNNAFPHPLDQPETTVGGESCDWL